MLVQLPAYGLTTTVFLAAVFLQLSLSQNVTKSGLGEGGRQFL